MLAAHTMGSQGRRSLPFGYDPTGVHGIGLPAFINHPGPPGQPLLSEQENEQMQDFFSAFDAEGQAHSHPSLPGYPHDNLGNVPALLQMPQTYVGHETYVRSPPTMDWHSQQMGHFQFGDHMNNMAMQTPTSPYTNGHMASPVNQMFAANPQTMQAFANGWQQTFPSHAMPPQRPDMNFGSDPNFMNSGYAAPDGPVDADISLLHYAMEPASSTTNTQPNSRPSSNVNTEPSSPVTTKKRKLNNVFQADSLRMTSINGPSSNGTASKRSPPPATNRKPRKSFVKHEQPPTPHSKSPTVDEDEVQEEDAEYDEDEEGEPTRSPSPPAPWPSSKARPQYRPPPPPKPPKPRKKSQSAASPVKTRPRRASSSTNAVSRVPLTAAQKKANHTNSEQRRRDATARSYAELYDCVPELEELGKQSTMKKLEVVVEKARAVKQRVEYLRGIVGRDPATGRVNPSHIATHQYGGDVNHLSGWR